MEEPRFVSPAMAVADGARAATPPVGRFRRRSEFVSVWAIDEGEQLGQTLNYPLGPLGELPSIDLAVFDSAGNTWRASFERVTSGFVVRLLSRLGLASVEARVRWHHEGRWSLDHVKRLMRAYVEVCGAVTYHTDRYAWLRRIDESKSMQDLVDAYHDCS